MERRREWQTPHFGRGRWFRCGAYERHRDAVRTECAGTALFYRRAGGADQRTGRHTSPCTGYPGTLKNTVASDPRTSEIANRGQTGLTPIPAGLEAESRLELESSRLSVGSGAAFRLDSPEHKARSIDAGARLWIRIDKIRVVQHVCCIDAYRERFGFRYPERLAQGRIESPFSESLQRHGHCAAMSRQRILKNDGADRTVRIQQCHCVEGTDTRTTTRIADEIDAHGIGVIHRTRCRALRIRHLRVLIDAIVASRR